MTGGYSMRSIAMCAMLFVRSGRGHHMQQVDLLYLLTCRQGDRCGHCGECLSMCGANSSIPRHSMAMCSTSDTRVSTLACDGYMDRRHTRRRLLSSSHSVFGPRCDGRTRRSSLKSFVLMGHMNSPRRYDGQDTLLILRLRMSLVLHTKHGRWVQWSADGDSARRLQGQ